MSDEHDYFDDQSLMDELAGLTERYEKSADDRELAIFELPPLQMFMDMQGMDEKDMDQMREALGDILRMMTSIRDIEDDDPFKMRKMADAMDVALYCIDEHGEIRPRPDDMEDDDWKENCESHQWIKRFDRGPYRIVLKWTGARATDDNYVSSMCAVEAFKMDGELDEDGDENGDRVDGIFHTNSRAAADMMYSALRIKWSDIYKEEQRDA